MISLSISKWGDQQWYLNSIWHRANGPAVTYKNGHRVWYWRAHPYGEYEHMMLVEQEKSNG